MELFQKVSAITTIVPRKRHITDLGEVGKRRNCACGTLSARCFVRDLWVLNTLPIALYAHSPAPRRPCDITGCNP